VAYPDLATLFPLIRPLPTVSGPGLPAHAGPVHARAARLPYRTAAVSDVLPLSMRQVGYQIGALIALALAVAMAVVRVPLRRRRAP
jgi:hypothetical protein